MSQVVIQGGSEEVDGTQSGSVTETLADSHTLGSVFATLVQGIRNLPGVEWASIMLAALNPENQAPAEKEHVFAEDKIRHIY